MNFDIRQYLFYSMIAMVIPLGTSSTLFGQTQKQYYETCRIWSEATLGAENFETAWEKSLSLRQHLEDVEFESSEIQKPIISAKKKLDEDLALLARMARINGEKPSQWDYAKGLAPLLLKEEPTNDEKGDFVLDLLKTVGAEIALSNLRKEHCEKLREIHWELFQFVLAGADNFGEKAPVAHIVGLRFGAKGDHAVIRQIIEGSPAARSDIPIGAIIEKVNEVKIESDSDISLIAAKNAPTDPDIYSLRLKSGKTKTFRIFPETIEVTPTLHTLVRRSWPGVWDAEAIRLTNITRTDLSNAIVIAICQSQGEKGFPVTTTLTKRWKAGESIEFGIRRQNEGFRPGFWGGVYSNARVIVVSPNASFVHEITNVDQQHDSYVQQEIDTRTVRIGYLNRKPGIFEPWNRGASIQFDGSRLPVEQVTIDFQYSNGQTKSFHWDTNSLFSNKSYSYRTGKWTQPPVKISAKFHLAETSYSPSWKIQTPTASQSDR